MRAKAAALDQPVATLGHEVSCAGRLATKPLVQNDDPILVVEQSEDDDDQLEGPPGVIFVRRKRAKPKDTPKEPAMSQDMQDMYMRMFNARPL